MDGKDTRIPYYVQVAETLRRRIMTDEYVEGALIPTVPELEDEFGVSNITIRMALDVLVQDGLLRRKRGIGTSVQKYERDLVVFELTGNFDSCHVHRVPSVELEVLEMKVAPARIMSARHSLSIPTGVFRLKKIRKHKGQPLG
jgi:DNA-binding GntR family transcriptional regulator